MKAPEGVAEDFVLHALGFAGVAFDGNAGARRSEHAESVGCADLMDAEEMGGIAHNDNAPEVIGACDDCQSPDRFVGTGAFGFGDDVRIGNTCSDEVIAADGAF